MRILNSSVLQKVSDSLPVNYHVVALSVLRETSFYIFSENS